MIGYHYYKEIKNLEKKFPDLKFTELEEYIYSLSIDDIEFIICEIPTNLAVIASATKDWQYAGIANFSGQVFTSKNYYLTADSYIKDNKRNYKIFYFPIINKNYFGSVGGMGDNNVFFKTRGVTKFILSKIKSS